MKNNITHYILWEDGTATYQKEDGTIRTTNYSIKNEPDTIPTQPKEN